MQARRLPRRIAILTYPGGQTLDVTGPFEVFSGANAWCRGRGDVVPAYALEILAAAPGPVRMSSGLMLVADRAYGAVRGGLDTLLVAGGDARAAAADARLLAWLRAMRPRARRVASVCTGAFVLAAAGLLDGRRATTHWAAAPALARQFPRVAVDPDAIWVHDGTVWTSAGVTAGMDLALALVEEDLGREAALTVARHLVVFLKRPGGQSQFSVHLEAQTVSRGPLKDLPEWIVEHLDGDLSVEALASRAAMSPRNFARVFVRVTGTTPAKFVERARVERARRLLEEGAPSVETVASECGFGSAERMRRTFRRHLRVVPLDYRRRFEVAGAPAPRRAMGGKR
jgi:transcriptional regulator GlxA family with amidase domain